MDQEKAIEILVELARQHGTVIPPSYLGTDEEETAMHMYLDAALSKDQEFLEKVDSALRNANLN